MKQYILTLALLASTGVLFAQTETKNAKDTTTSHNHAAATYTCPMHPDVVSSKPGKCPECNMDLTRSKKEQMKMEVMKMYTCPMHPKQVSKEAGKCPDCGMEMVEKKKASGKKGKLKA